MRYVDEYRQPELCQQLIAEIRQLATRQWTIMEVCGGQTHGLLRYGIDIALKEAVQLIHGPGCPVCVTPIESIDFATELARRPEVVLASFGDMLRVPGSRENLLQVRAEGGNVHIVYSPLDAVQFAVDHPDQQIVFFAVGFETTTPATALAVHQAGHRGLDNFYLLVSHVRVLPAMEMLMANKDSKVQGFLGAGHVCTVTGYQCYEEFVRKYQLPLVVTGFEPVDLLAGILECIRQLESGEATVCNRYSRSALVEGNRQALEIVDDVYEICDRPWRGLGTIAGGGVRLREKWARFDAAKQFTQLDLPVIESTQCRSGEVLSGQIKPVECEHFSTACTPESPLGAPMVSAEGACAAYYRYASDPSQQTVQE